MRELGEGRKGREEEDWEEEGKGEEDLRKRKGMDGKIDGKEERKRRIDQKKRRV